MRGRHDHRIVGTCAERAPTSRPNPARGTSTQKLEGPHICQEVRTALVPRSAGCWREPGPEHAP
eukprot:8374393-Alexandrium_andersonii.AAC.1